MTRTLGAPNLVRMPIRGFLQDSRASDGMVATALYFVGRVLCRPWNAFGDAGAVVPFCAQRILVGLLEGGPGFKVGSRRAREDDLSPLRYLS